MRHNAVRNVCFEEAVSAGVRAEREKAGLLPGRPGADGLPPKHGKHGRRPADVWLDRGVGGGGEALDFAINSGMQSELFRPVAEEPGYVFHRYEDMKRSYKGTDAACKAAGFTFVPLVVEAHAGGWSPTLRAVVDWISKRAAPVCQEEPPAVSLRIAQRISCTLLRENARAVLRRTAGLTGLSFQPSGWDDPETAGF